MGIARKTLEEKTVERFRGYPSLPSDKSENKPDMTETGALGGNPQFTPLQVIMQKMEHMELQAWAERDAEREALHKEFQAVKRKEESKAMLKSGKLMTPLQELQRCWSRVSKQMGRKDTWICCMERLQLGEPT